MSAGTQSRDFDGNHVILLFNSHFVPCICSSIFKFVLQIQVNGFRKPFGTHFLGFACVQCLFFFSRVSDTHCLITQRSKHKCCRRLKFGTGHARYQPTFPDNLTDAFASLFLTVDKNTERKTAHITCRSRAHEICSVVCIRVLFMHICIMSNEHVCCAGPKIQIIKTV